TDNAGNTSTPSAAVSFTIDTVPPITSNVVVTPSTGYVTPTVTAMVASAVPVYPNIVAAEWFIDSPGAPGTGTAMSGNFTSPMVNVSGSLAAQFGMLAIGKHTIYVDGEDAAGNWSALASAPFVKEGCFVV